MSTGERDRPVLLKMEHITKEFAGVRALDDVRFELYSGEVHALIGENGAGKSTLMNILLGAIHADSGEIIYQGKRVHFNQPYDALKAGISMIHQEISLMDNMTVSENIWIGREKQFQTNGLIDRKKMNRATEELLNRLGIRINPADKVKDLSIASMQMVELARAVSYESQIIIMDEPTSALTQSEVNILYRVVRGLSSKGTSIIFISHKLKEIFDICDRITVMRDGRYIDTCNCSAITMNDLIRLIVGRELTQIYPPRNAASIIGNEALHVEGLRCTGVYEDITFTVRSGEIVGFCGLMGAGRTEIMRGLFGVDAHDGGSIQIDGRSVVIKSPQDAIRCGMGMVTEDRLHLGGMRTLSIKNNMTIVKLKDFLCAGIFIHKREESKACADMVERLNVKASSLNQLIGQLSGGNQQKAILGKWLMNKPRILILDEPTRGIDVGSKYEIYTHIIDLARQGMAIIIVSSELPEVLGISDRIYVVRHGRIVAEHKNENLTQEILIKEEFGE